MSSSRGTLRSPAGQSFLASSSPGVTNLSPGTNTASACSMTSSPPASSSITQQTDHHEFSKTIKTLFSSSARVFTLLRDLLRETSTLNRHLQSLYTSSPESLISTPLTSVLHSVEKELLSVSAFAGSPLQKELEFEWASAERWYSNAFRTLRPFKSSSEEVAAFSEQRMDGLDRAALSYVKLVSWMFPGHSREFSQAMEDACEGGVEPVKDPASATSFNSVLENRVASHYLRMHMEDAMTEETLDFWRSVQSLRSERDMGKARERARRIFARHLAPEAPREINVSSSVKVRVGTAIESEQLDLSPMFQAQQEMYQLMVSSNIYSQFRASQYFARLGRRLSLRTFAPPLSQVRAVQANATPANLPPPSASLASSSASASASGSAQAHSETSGHGKASTMTTTTTHRPHGGSDALRSSGNESTLRGKGRAPSTSAGEGSCLATASEDVSSQQSQQQQQHATESLSILQVLLNRELYRDFKQFLRERGLTKPLLFWRDTNKVLATVYPDLAAFRQAVCNSLVEKYLLPSDGGAASGPHMGISEELLSELQALLLMDPESQQLTKARLALVVQNCQDEALQYIRRTTFRQYCASDRWKSLGTVSTTPKLGGQAGVPPACSTSPPATCTSPDTLSAGGAARCAPLSSPRGPLSSSVAAIISSVPGSRLSMPPINQAVFPSSQESSPAPLSPTCSVKLDRSALAASAGAAASLPPGSPDKSAYVSTNPSDSSARQFNELMVKRQSQMLANAHDDLVKALAEAMVSRYDKLVTPFLKEVPQTPIETPAGTIYPPPLEAPPPPEPVMTALIAVRDSLPEPPEDHQPTPRDRACSVAPGSRAREMLTLCLRDTRKRVEAAERLISQGKGLQLGLTENLVRYWRTYQSVCAAISYAEQLVSTSPRGPRLPPLSSSSSSIPTSPATQLIP